MKQLNEQANRWEAITLREYAQRNFNSSIFAEQSEETIKQELAHSSTLRLTDGEIRSLAKLILAEEKTYINS